MKRLALLAAGALLLWACAYTSGTSAPVEVDIELWRLDLHSSINRRQQGVEVAPSATASATPTATATPR
jgi:hypothetical protein